MNYTRCAVLLLSTLAWMHPALSDYLYTITVDKTSVTDTTSFQFSAANLFTGVLSPAPNVLSVPFPGAVPRPDLDTFRISGTGVFVITFGTLLGKSPVIAYQFTGGTSIPLSASGDYVLNSADVYSFATGLHVASTTGSISIQPIVGSGVPTPEPAVITLLECGFLILISARCGKPARN